MKGESKIETELDIFNILSTLQKLRAAVSVLVDHAHCEDCIEKVYELYYKNATIFLDEGKQEEFENTKSVMMKFFNSDSRVIVKN